MIPIKALGTGRWRRSTVLLAALCLLLLAATLIVGPLRANTPAKAAPAFNYGEALQKSIYFYDEQVSGPKPSWDPVTWVGDSALTDGADHGIDLTGGWYDAGDNVKFGLPMAYSATMLAWGAIANRDAYTQDGQLTSLLNNLRFVNDYFIKAHPSANVLYGQVGDPSADHAFWGPPEVMQMARPSYRIDTSCPGSDLAGETAAAMAASSMVFQSTDASYAATLLNHAKQLYSFADNFRGKYDACMPVSGFYTSFSGYNDELVWGAIWLYMATNDPTYLAKAQSYYANLSVQDQTTMKSYKWTISWDDVSYGCYILLAQLTGQQQYKDDAQRFLDWWTVGVNGSQVRMTPGGEAVLDVWGTLRYAANTAFLALVYADFLGTSNTLYSRYHDFAVKEINYILGANPRNCSYIVGFGTCYPQTPHHRRSHGSWSDSLTDPTYQRHILYGAMVGGPNDGTDSFTDNRQTFQTNEPADDYNAALTGALARVYKEFGGSPVASLPDKAKDDDELYVQASVNASGTNFTEIKALFINKTGWPARVTSNLSLRYYFTLEAGVSISQITLNGNFSQCGTNFLSGPTLFSGNTYYVTVSCAGTAIFPGGQGNFKKEVQFRMTSSGAWDPTNDWSYQGVPTTPGSTPVKVSNIVVFDGSTQAFGTPPNGTGVTPTPGITPTPGTTPTPGVTPTVGVTPTPTPRVTPTPTVVVPPTPTPTPGVTPTATTGTACSIHYAVTNQWSDGFGVTITITNTGTTTINGWSLTFAFPNGQTITQLWNGSFTQSGANVTVTNLSYNGTLAPGTTLTSNPGFNGSWNGSNNAPASFKLNGVTCSIV